MSSEEESSGSPVPEPRKYCHCKLTCGELLSSRARREHKSKILDKSTILPSESEYDSEEDESFAAPESPMNFDRDDDAVPHRDTVSPDYPPETFPDSVRGSPMDIDRASTLSTSPDADIEFDSDSGSEGSDSGLDSENSCGMDDWGNFDETEDMNTPMTREEMIRELEEMLDEEEEGDLWDIRMAILMYPVFYTQSIQAMRF
ncbi:hypothetical protein R3P38DRAFT_2906334 [Favolaschia claudopus]|uniref:Uncharacterized protein n=1 Tax=Favolaschia claudopus TaxID=2862362 RepID=A0AAW0CKG1_9AGAR